MNTSKSTITSAGVQQPLLSRSQLIPGSFLTGIAMSHVWQIMNIVDDILVIQKMPHDPTADHHTHTFTRQGSGEICGCGLRKQKITDFLPIKPDKARVHVITPVDGRSLIEPKPFAIYAGVIGSEVKVYTLEADGGNSNRFQWNEALPIIPELYEIWRVPPALVAYFVENPAPNSDTEADF